jgi:hypothetical protein
MVFLLGLFTWLDIRFALFALQAIIFIAQLLYFFPEGIILAFEFFDQSITIACRAASRS